jgi:hypothetical protein
MPLMEVFVRVLHFGNDEMSDIEVKIKAKL